MAVERCFLVATVISAFEGGFMVTKLQTRMRPSYLIVVKTFVLIVACAVMISPSTTTMAKISAYCAGWALGGVLVGLAVYVHEDYGTEAFGLLYGSFLTAGGFGFYAFNEILFG